MRPSLSLRIQLLLSFAGVAVGSAAVIGVFAYRSSTKGLELGAVQAVAAAAQGREEALTRLLSFRRNQADGFLTSVTSSCGEVAVGGRIAWEPQCVRTALDEFRFTERAAAARLLYRERRLAESGRWISIAVPEAGSLGHIVPSAEGDANLAMQARNGDLSLILRFSNDEILGIFHNDYGLGSSGEVFLVGADGRLITPLRYAPTSDEMRGATDPEQQLREKCAAGKSEEIIAADYRGVKTIHGIRPVSTIGGCIDAHLTYEEALAPTDRMRQQLVYRGLGFLAVAVALSLAASGWIARPIRQLVASARVMQAGRFDTPVTVGGPSEVRELGAAFKLMETAIRDLLSSEQHARLEAEEANRAKDDFLAVVSHELRTPLTAVMGWAHLLNTGKLDPRHADRALQTIERSAEVQSKLIDDLLDVSRIGSGSLRLHRRPVPISAAVDAAMESIRPHAEGKRIELHTEIDPAAGLVAADPQRLQQIVGNLLSNAVKFTPEGGRVDVGVRRSQTGVELSVRDTGVGIPYDFLPYVFDRFRQGDSASTRTHGGLGLGLAIVKNLVEMHGGTVRAESAGHWRGARFVVSLPSLEAAESENPGVQHPVENEGEFLADVHVLVVDDDERTREVVSAILTSVGANVTTAGSAAEARDVLAREQPAVVVADIAMPVEDGYSLMRSLRASGTAADKVPAIALTAFARAEDVDAAFAAGFQAHLAKPVDVDDLVDAVAVLTGKRAA
jgi:signal transduction histidine kinase/CheY-like chemotaxis protein